MSETTNDSVNPQPEQKPGESSQITQEAPLVAGEAPETPTQEADTTLEKNLAVTDENPTAPALETDTTKQIGAREEEMSPHDAPTQPSKKEHNSDYYRTYIMDRDNALHRMLSVPQTRELRAPFDVKRITLHIRGMKEHIVLTPDRVVIVGRADLRSEGFKPDIDLTPYGGRERGVSRAHVRLHVQDGKLFLTDLYSANGTHMGGEKLTPEKTYELHNGDEILFGALGVRVEIIE